LANGTYNHRQLIQLLDKPLCVVPRNLLYRQVVTLETRRVGAHYCLPLTLGYLRSSHEKAIVYRDPVNRSLAWETIVSPHHELAGWNVNQVDSVLIPE